MVPRRRHATDGTTVLTLYVILLLGLPSNYVVGAIGAAGSPAQLLGLALLITWVARRLSRSFPASPASQPVRKATVVFVAAVMASYVAAMSRPIDGTEASAANRGLIGLASWVGIILIAGDEIPSRARLETLLRRLVLAGAAVATLGVVQFQTRMAFTNYLLLPGLTANGEVAGVGLRQGYARPAGTALHPIEFGVMISMLLPLALHFAVSDRDKPAVRRWFPLAAIGMAIPLSVSRSAVLCTVTAMLVMLPVLAPRVRFAVAAIGVLMLGVVYITVPGMIGAILGLFTGIGGDNSAASRTDSYALAGEFISHAPVFGRGFFTFLPSYRILDNQYLGSLIELGIFGLAALLLLFLIGIRTAWVARQRSRDPQTRQLTQALMASLTAGAVSFAFFDAFAFPMVSAVMFLLLGITGAQHQLAGHRPAVAGRDGRSAVPRSIEPVGVASR